MITTYGNRRVCEIHSEPGRGTNVKIERLAGSVNTYIRRVYAKLHVRSRWKAVAKFSHFSMTESRRRPARE